MSDPSIISRRLKEGRQRSGLSQKQLGIKAGIDEFAAGPRVNQYERGKHTPDFMTLSRLASVLGLPVPYFYCADADLAELIVRFSLSSKTQRRKALQVLQQEE